MAPQSRASSSFAQGGQQTSSSARSSRIFVLTKRYKDAYLVARAINGYGAFIKSAGVIIALLLGLIGIAVASQGRLGDATFALGALIVVAGIISGVWFYAAGVLFSAQGQVLQASLDNTVNGSPFLTNDHKAQIMSLPEV